MCVMPCCHFEGCVSCSSVSNCAIPCLQAVRFIEKHVLCSAVTHSQMFRRQVCYDVTLGIRDVWDAILSDREMFVLQCRESIIVRFDYAETWDLERCLFGCVVTNWEICVMFCRCKSYSVVPYFVLCFHQRVVSVRFMEIFFRQLVWYVD